MLSISRSGKPYFRPIISSSARYSLLTCSARVALFVKTCIMQRNISSTPAESGRLPEKRHLKHSKGISLHLCVERDRGKIWLPQINHEAKSWSIPLSVMPSRRSHLFWILLSAMSDRRALTFSKRISAMVHLKGVCTFSSSRRGCRPGPYLSSTG